MQKFKIGQRVRITEAYGDTGDTGREGVVTEYNAGFIFPYKVVIDNDYTDYWLFYENEIEAIDSEPTLLDFIEDAESRYFRSNSDTGANSNALFVWNRLRVFAGLDELTHADLRQRQVDSSSNVTIEELEKYDDLHRRYDRLKYQIIQEAIREGRLPRHAVFMDDDN